MIVASYGGGVNSTAMLIGCVERSFPIDDILFADTGGEWPETYAFAKQFSKWLAGHGYPTIRWVKYVTKEQGKYHGPGEVVTLEQHCHDTGFLPSVAYGKRSCSMKFKVEPQEEYIASTQRAKNYWATGGKILKLIGFDAGEWHRIRHDDNDKYIFHYPLVEWGWFRSDCVAAIQRHGLCPPRKSACFFCPMTKKHEIRQLRLLHPSLLDRAIQIERKATNSRVAGLGVEWSWEKFAKADEAQDPLFPDAFAEKPCTCMEGE